MNDIEFEIMDELYFIQTYQNLQKELQLNDDELAHWLKELVAKGWVKCFIGNNDEVFNPLPTFENQYKNYHYLATKDGLLAHNTIG
ncbi:MAG: hypothetical protein ACFCUU_02665 [Cyclobacteriaceae bacterium]